jgi:peptide deformylase
MTPQRLSLLTGSLETLQLPGLALRQTCPPVPPDLAPDALRSLVTEMFACMYEARGIGLAAPQVGVLWRVFVADLQKPEFPSPLVMVNPRVVEASEETEEGREGCLSIPGYYSLKVPRHARIIVEALDHRLDPFRMEAEGLLARVLQHEYDHLEGILYLDRLNSPEDLIAVSGDYGAVTAEKTVGQLYDETPEEVQNGEGVLTRIS